MRNPEFRDIIIKENQNLIDDKKKEAEIKELEEKKEADEKPKVEEVPTVSHEDVEKNIKAKRGRKANK